MKLRTFLATILVSVAATGCGGDDPAPEVAPTETSDAQASSPSVSPTRKAAREPRVADGRLKVTGGDRTFDAAPKLVAGPTTITFRNAGTISHELRVVRLKPDDDLALLARRPRTEILERVSQLARTRRLFADETTKLELDLNPGRYALLCLLGFPESTHAGSGMFRELIVIKDG